jgi:hypothetical protein
MLAPKRKMQREGLPEIPCATGAELADDLILLMQLFNLQVLKPHRHWSARVNLESDQPGSGSVVVDHVISNFAVELADEVVSPANHNEVVPAIGVGDIDPLHAIFDRRQDSPHGRLHIELSPPWDSHVKLVSLHPI